MGFVLAHEAGEVFSKIETVPGVVSLTQTEPRFASARSSLPSPLKSPTATEIGRLPGEKADFATKLAAPAPGRIETVSQRRFASARSSLASPLKSPTATEYGELPVPKSVFAAKLPVPVPSRIETVCGSIIASPAKE